MKIWALFSISNDYDQPNNNLEYWWTEKPTIEQVGTAMEKPINNVNDETIVKIVGVWQGQEIDFCGMSYRIEELCPGKVGDA